MKVLYEALDNRKNTVEKEGLSAEDNSTKMDASEGHDWMHGSLARSAKTLASGEQVKLVFADGQRSAVVDGARAGKTRGASPEQGDLF